MVTEEGVREDEDYRVPVVLILEISKDGVKGKVVYRCTKTKTNQYGFCDALKAFDQGVLISFMLAYSNNINNKTSLEIFF